MNPRNKDTGRIESRTLEIIVSALLFGTFYFILQNIIIFYLKTLIFRNILIEYNYN